MTKADFNSVVFLGMGVAFTVLMTQMVVLGISYFKPRRTPIHYSAVSRMIHTHQALATFMALLSVLVSNQIASSTHENENTDCSVTGIVLQFFALLTLAWGVARAWYVLHWRELDNYTPNEHNIDDLRLTPTQAARSEPCIAAAATNEYIFSTQWQYAVRSAT